LTIIVSYRGAREALETQTSGEALKQVQSVAQNIDTYVDRVAVLPRTLAARQEAVKGDEYTLDLLAQVLDALPPDEAWGVYVVFDHRPPSAANSMIWVDRNSMPEGLHPKGGYRDRDLPWYAEPKRTGKLYISEPYFDKGGSNTEIVSVTQPFTDADGNFL